MRIIILMFFISLAFLAKAQYLHTPSEIDKIKKNSSISYKVDSVLPAPRITERPILVFPLEDQASLNHKPINPDHIQTNKIGKKYLKKADNFYFAKKYKQAIHNYHKSGVVQQVPEVMIRIAISYQKIGLPDDAIPIYKSLLKKDSSNAFLYFQLADCHQQKKEYEEACRQITLAHLYNRNNEVYLDSLISYYKNNSWKFRKLDFIPQYDITKISDSIVYLQAISSPWLAYASCKAIWIFEPDYRKKMKFISTEDARIVEEKECLLNALVTFERLDAPEKIDFPGLYTLSSALPDGRVDDFIMYEISATQNPEIIRQLSRERVERLVNYVYTYRVKQLEF